MSDPTLVIDVSNLAYRALFSTSGMYYDGQPTGVLYGLLVTCRDLERRFGTTKFAFCFDTRNSRRSALCPEYKAHRAKAREEEDEERKQARLDMYFQVQQFRELLPTWGANNVFREDGFEADDLIASIVRSNPKERIIIVSSDEDLWQLLEGDRVKVYRPTPKTLYTEADLLADYGVAPCQWASVKAWAGDVSDNIVGVRGVGIKTAAKFISGKLSKPEKLTDHVNVYNMNIQLTRLPFPKTPACWLSETTMPINWQALGEYIGSNDIDIPGVR